MKLIPAVLIAGAFFGTSSAAHAMGRIPKRDFEAKVQELKECSLRVNELNENLSQLKESSTEAAAQAKSKIESLEARNGELLTDMNSSKSDLQKRLADLMKEKQAVEKEKEEIDRLRQEEVNKLKSTYEDLMTDMKKEIEQGSIQITQLQDKLSVNMVDKILFNSGEADVNAEGKKALLKVANILKKVENKQIRIEGHTDNVPIGGALKEKFSTNWELSTARATAVARYLTETCGVHADRVSAAGYSQFKPIADNSTAEGRTKNRRIEIALVPLDVQP